MTAPDIDGVLAAHWGCQVAHVTAEGNILTCGAIVARTGHWDEMNRAHVAAVLREQITAAQAEAYEHGRADERQHGALLRNYHHWSSISSGPPIAPPNPYRAAQVAPSRVPGEET